jgi:hypothetical protein
MANIINGTDTGSGGLITTGDSSDELQIQTAEVARVTLTNTAVVVNESGADVDFRVEGDTDANLLFVDASTDRVGIGTSSPAQKLDVSGQLKVINGGDGFFINPNASDTRLVTSGTLPLTFRPNDTERMSLTSDGYLRMASGTGGIQFNGDTAAANALDDYEEGTWTPAIIGSTTAGTGTYSGRTGTYTKIGRMVYVRAEIEWSAHTGTGNMYINGLPFTSSVSAGVSIGQFANITLTAGNVLYAAVYGDSTVRFWESPTGGGAGGYVQVDTAGYLMLGFSYLTTT